MKTSIHYSIAITLILFCFNFGHAQYRKVKGNGTLSTKTFTTSDYNAINVVGFMDVFLEVGTEGTITVRAEENIHQYLEVTSKNGTLTLKIRKGINVSTKKGIHITVPFADINNVSLTGSGDVITHDLIKTNAFEAELTGSGDMDLEVEANSIDAKITGSGDLKLSGNVTNFEVKITGSGDFNGRSLISVNTQVYVSGSGDAHVYASNSIKARVNGSGDIQYSGNPATSDTKVMGSGDIDAN